MLAKKIQSLLENKLFGVCNYWADKLGIATSSVRLFYIYLSFFTFGSPIIIYLAMAFLLDTRKFLRRRRSTIYDF